MAATPLIIGEAQKAALAALRARARAAPIDMPPTMELIKTKEGNAAHIRRMAAEFTIDLPMAFTVTFTIETGHPDGAMRHMSMASKRRARLPTPLAVWLVCEELGFVGTIKQCAIWMEDIGAGDQAVNVIQPVSMTAEAGHG